MFIHNATSIIILSLVCKCKTLLTADPQVERCTIYNGESACVAVGGQGRDSFTHCDIHSNDLAGIRLSIHDTADPRVVGLEYCTIHNRKSAGACV